MEALLSLAFDNLSSYDALKIRKGLRQIEGLLAQICLSVCPRPPSSSSVSASTSASSTASTSEQQALLLRDLSGDAAFREFFKLQEGFEWNVAIRVVQTLDRLMGRVEDEGEEGEGGGGDGLILGGLEVLRGCLLVHPPSKVLFARELHMNILLDLLEPVNPPAIQSATLLTLVAALLDNPFNTRTFEALDGLLTVTSLFKSRSTSREVKLKLVEFLYFYLMPEGPESGSESGAPDDGVVMGTGEKQELLGRYLGNVEDLVKDLRTCTPFGGVC